MELCINSGNGANGSSELRGKDLRGREREKEAESLIFLIGASAIESKLVIAILF